MNKWIEILFGLVLVILAVVAWITNFWQMGTAAIELFKGGVIWLVILLGLVLLLLGISDLKN